MHLRQKGAVMSDLQQLADQLAECEGWYYDDDQDGWCKPGVPMCKHPFPVNDLTALAAAWPERWSLCVDYAARRGASDPWHYAFIQGQYGALDREMGLGFSPQPGFPTEWEARARLHLSVRQAERTNDEPPS